METIKINGNSYELVVSSYQLKENGGRVVFKPGEKDFAEVKADLQETDGIELLDAEGKVIISRTDLVYAGRLQEDDNYLIGTEHIETGVDENQEPVYETKNVFGTVMIADFREPDLREQYAKLEARMDYLAMMTNVDVEV